MIMMDLDVGERKITVRKGMNAQIVQYIGSDHWKVRYLDGNKTTMYSFKTTEIDWNGNNVEEMKKRYQ